MAHYAALFAVLTALAVPARGARKQTQSGELTTSNAHAEKKLSMKPASPPFFWRQPTTTCFNTASVSCPKEAPLAKPIETKDDCENAFKALGGATLPKRHPTKGEITGANMSSYTAEEVKSHKLHTIGNRRGCLVRTTDTNAVFVTFVATDPGEYYGSDVCGCYENEKKHAVLKRATTQNLEKVADVNLADVETRYKGAPVQIVPADGGDESSKESAVILGEYDGDVVVQKVSSGEQLKVKVEKVSIDLDGDTPLTKQAAALMVDQISAHCACYGKTQNRQTLCCLTGEVPRVKPPVGGKTQFHWQKLDLVKCKEEGECKETIPTCKHDKIASVSPECVATCSRHEMPQDRTMCKAPVCTFVKETGATEPCDIPKE